MEGKSVSAFHSYSANTTKTLHSPWHASELFSFLVGLRTYQHSRYIRLFRWMAGVKGLHFDVYLVMYFKHRLLQSEGRSTIQMQSTRSYSFPPQMILPVKPTRFQLVRRFLPLTKPKSHHRVHKSPPMVSILIQVNPAQTLSHYCSTIHFQRFPPATS